MTIARPSAVLYQTVLTEMPANAEPLLLAAEVKRTALPRGRAARS